MKTNQNKVVAKILAGALAFGMTLIGINSITNFCNVIANGNVLKQTQEVAVIQEDNIGFAMGQSLLIEEVEKETDGNAKMSTSNVVKLVSMVSDEACNEDYETMIFNAASKHADKLEGMTIILTDGTDGSIRQVDNELYISYDIALDLFTGVVID